MYLELAVCDIYIYIYIYISDPRQRAHISQKQDERNLYAIMKTMCPLGYHHNGVVATHALGTHDVTVHHLPK